MPIDAVCTGCRKKYQFAESAAGKTVRCKKCGDIFKIPIIEHEDDDSLFAELIDETAAVEDSEDEASSAIFGSPKAKRRASSHTPADNSARGARGSAKTGLSRAVKWIAIALGGTTTLLLLCCGGGYYLFSLTNPPAAGPQASEPFPLETVKIPAFPELGAAQVIPETAVSVYHVNLSAANPGSAQPAARMQLRVYVPPGEHAAGSLGCVLVGPAGTNLMTGNNLDAADYHTETLPYALAGYVAVIYSLDGALPAGSDGSRIGDLVIPYRDFSAAFAGLANSRTALEFVLARLPHVDSQRIFAAGHSSAGTLALLFAEHEPRLKGCIAYAPVFDVENHLSLIARFNQAGNQFPGFVDFTKRSSPSTHLARIRCPVFLFWALDDRGVDSTQRFAREMTTLGPDVTVKTVPTGGHYEPMVDPGIPLAIQWLRSLPGEQPADAPTSLLDQ